MDQHEQHREQGRIHDDDRPDKHHDRTTPIIVNGREKTVIERKLSVSDLVKLAFETPPTGEFICFTVTYRRGHGNKPDGTLEEGETVRVKKGMIFNVTATDKS